MKLKMLLCMTLREEGELYTDFSFTLPLTRAWWEDTSCDLHLQFEGFEDYNICPHGNGHDSEMEIPKKAKVFRRWLKDQGGPWWGRIHVRSNTLEMGREKKSMKLPQDAYEDLVNNWESPNR